MKLIRDRILKDGKVYPGGVLKVDSFLNHKSIQSCFRKQARNYSAFSEMRI